MFDSIDLSGIDDMNSPDSMGGDNGLTFDSGVSHTDDFPGMVEDSFGIETTIGGEDAPIFSSVKGYDSNLWGADNVFSGGEFNLNESQQASPEQIDISQIENEISFRGSEYSQSEINSHISDAKHKIADAESDIRHHTSIANSKARMGEPHSFEDSQIRHAQDRLNEARSNLSKWQHMKPSK